MVSKSLRDHNTKLSLVEFAYNKTPSNATSYFTFEVRCDINSLTHLHLIPIPQESKVSFDVEERAKEMKKLHESN